MFALAKRQPPHRTTMYEVPRTVGLSDNPKACIALDTGSCVSRLPPVSFYRFENNCSTTHPAAGRGARGTNLTADPTHRRTGKNRSRPPGDTQEPSQPAAADSEEAVRYRSVQYR